MKSNLKDPTPEDVVRIIRIENPAAIVKGEGIYEWRYMKEKYFIDCIDLKKDVERMLPGRSEDVIHRLTNFKQVYIILPTGEVITE